MSRFSRLRVVVVTLALVGCSGESINVSDVVGVWDVTTVSGTELNEQMIFENGGGYLIGAYGWFDSGRFEIDGSSLVLTSTSDGYCAEGDRGEYQISLGDQEWTITLIDDECPYRPAIAPSTLVPSKP